MYKSFVKIGGFKDPSGFRRNKYMSEADAQIIYWIWYLWRRTTIILHYRKTKLF
jgi:hypothetical protein